MYNIPILRYLFVLTHLLYKYICKIILCTTVRVGLQSLKIKLPILKMFYFTIIRISYYIDYKAYAI